MNHNHEHSSKHMVHDTHPHHVDVNHKHSNTSKHHHSMTTGTHHSMMMTSFHGGFTETILFEPWETTSVPIFIGSCILIFILGILHQGLKEYLQYVEQPHIQNRVISNNGNENEIEPMNTTEASVHQHEKILPRYPKRFLYTVLYIAYLLLSYMLMLIVMTFNVYLFLAVILGIGVGHWLYTWSCLMLPVNTTQSDT